jgi:hypothetical protein
MMSEGHPGWGAQGTTRPHRRATGLKVAVEDADDYVPAGSPPRPSGVTRVSRPKTSRARGVEERGGGYVAWTITEVDRGGVVACLGGKIRRRRGGLLLPRLISDNQY